MNMADMKPGGAKPQAAAKGTGKKKSSGPKAYKPGRPCPKCGPGVHLALHSNRLSCGRCGYTEYTQPRS